jgi:hypothetical protein
MSQSPAPGGPADNPLGKQVERLNGAVFGDDSRYPSTPGLAQKVADNQRVLFGEYRDGKLIAPSVLERLGSVETELQKLSKSVDELKDRRRYWLELIAAGITILGVALNVALQLRGAGIVR